MGEELDLEKGGACSEAARLGVRRATEEDGQSRAQASGASVEGEHRDAQHGELRWRGELGERDRAGESSVWAPSERREIEEEDAQELRPGVRDFYPATAEKIKDEDGWIFPRTSGGWRRRRA
jgi:hypothetical protein